MTRVIIIIFFVIIFGLLGLFALKLILKSKTHVINIQSEMSESDDNKLSVTKPSFCQRETFEDKAFIVCEVHPKNHEVTLFLNDRNHRPFKYFRHVEKMLQKQQKTLGFAVNGGMYHKDFSAVGLYIENGKKIHEISTKEGPGNFHMKPNGVFFIADESAGILETSTYITSQITPELATQSGPMLVINNVIHPRFIPNSPYLEYRNGVGVKEDGTVVFINSEKKVNFDELARFFRDKHQTPNALYLDGSISSLYAPELQRYDWWYPLGPIIGVVIDK
ncbi:phosphodiester glycosidase family protein [Bartonella tamiae]|uniref:Phosphodiester glycosidase domain-containing protein n=1 Tax=Bartonella tamiae Th239 TaxID=1094558 RepID=J1JVT1_9HYPH|nr:phosphodiester glycosidase family protein [Bartonella tamiae]EJF88670.1 hypothetical protein ME5_01221 [Bartonella tamiae Th239]EJF95080.1 hypothetical protein MEG_00661 [Bartonella tamiae Th307]